MTEEKSLTWVRAGNKLTVILPNGQPKTVTEGEAAFNQVLDAIKTRDWKVIPDLLDPKAAIFNFSDGVFQVINNVVHVEGKPVPDGLSKKIIGFAKEGLPYAPLINFWNKLQKNTSYRTINGLFEFLDRHGYPITEDGDIIAYKGVREDWTDCYSGKFSNKIGEIVSMPRNEVDENCDLTCRPGLHVSSYEFATNNYGNGAGGHTIMVSIDPSDVVSMPNSYEFTKFRVCKYTVLSEVFKEEKGNLYKGEFEENNSCNGDCDICSCNSDEEEVDECDCENYNCIEYDSHHQNCKCNGNDNNCCML